jgi:REP element-mobilizing transposase RayT
MSTARELPTRKKHRLSPAVYANSAYEFSFTVCARHQGMPFRNRQLANIVVNSLLWTRKRYNWVLYCYCLMEDHLHFVARLTNQDVRIINGGARGFISEGILEHLGRFKSFTTRESWKLGFANELWQQSSYDRVLDMDRPFQEVVEYVLSNPVRKGLVKNWEDWPYARIVDPWE